MTPSNAGRSLLMCDDTASPNRIWVPQVSRLRPGKDVRVIVVLGAPSEHLFVSVARVGKHYARFSIPTNFLFSGPVYTADGRMIFPSCLCSITCAHQPAVRAITNSGVKRSTGTPIKS